MTVKQARYLKKGENSDVQYEFIPPAPTETVRGGIKASPKSNTDTNEVKLGSDGKLYVSENAKKDGNGNVITDTYMVKNNPVGTGSFSMNRKNNSTIGIDSTTLGTNCAAPGVASVSEGAGTIAAGHYQHVQGRYNIEDTNNRYAHIVGVGISETSRSNGYALDWDGNAWYKGGLSLGIPFEDKSLATLHGSTDGSFDFVNGDYKTRLTCFGNFYPDDSTIIPPEDEYYSEFCCLGKDGNDGKNRWNNVFAKSGDFSDGLNVRHLDADYITCNNTLSYDKVAATTETGNLVDAAVVAELINRIKGLFCTNHPLVVDVTPGENYTDVTYDPVLVGNCLRSYMKATRKATISGNISPGEVIMKVKVYTDDMIDTLYNVSFCTGGHGSATCYTGSIQTNTNKNGIVTSIEFNICAASYIFSATTISAHFIMPAVLNFENFLDI